MKLPTYLTTGMYDVVRCSICGCLVDDQARHTSFHEALARHFSLEGD